MEQLSELTSNLKSYKKTQAIPGFFYVNEFMPVCKFPKINAWISWVPS